MARCDRRRFLSALALAAGAAGHARAAQPDRTRLARDRSIVISGDTAPSPNLAKLARGADVLVHAVMYPPAIDRLVAKVPNAATLKASILAHQTSAEDAGRLAQEAGVKTLVLSHLVPPDDPEVTEAMWLDAARRRFRGTVIVGRDLLEV
jgi:ribonuclease BN (tRNA processing enzyme)